MSYKKNNNKIVIFGNSGSGKSTLAKKLSNELHLSHLDLDILAWEKSKPPKRKPVVKSEIEINSFISENENWVIEGCYSDLLEIALRQATELIFLNPGEKICINNCKNRPWESHKYSSREEQDSNLAMLISWIKNYSIRNDEFSLQSHRELYNHFSGKKTEYCENLEI